MHNQNLTLRAHIHTPLHVSPGHGCHVFFLNFGHLCRGWVLVELAVADSYMNHHCQTPGRWRNETRHPRSTHAHTLKWKSAEDQFHQYEQPCGTQGGRHQSVCPPLVLSHLEQQHHLRLWIWLRHEQTSANICLAVTVLASGLILYSIYSVSSFYLLRLDSLFFLLMPFLIIFSPSSYSIFISRLPYFLFCLYLYLLIVLCQHTRGETQSLCSINDGALLRHRCFYKYSHVFRHLGKWQCNDWSNYQFYSVFHWNRPWRDLAQGQWAPSEDRK